MASYRHPELCAISGFKVENRQMVPVFMSHRRHVIKFLSEEFRNASEEANPARKARTDAENRENVKKCPKTRKQAVNELIENDRKKDLEHKKLGKRKTGIQPKIDIKANEKVQEKPKKLNSNE